MPDSPLGLPHVALPHVMYNVVQLPGQTAGFLGAGLRALPDHQRPQRAAVRRLDLEAAGGRFRRPAQGAEPTALGDRSPAGQPARVSAAPLDRRALRQSVRPVALRGRPPQPRHRQGAGRSSRPLRPQHARAKHASGPPPGRIGRPVRQRERSHPQRAGRELGQPPERLSAAPRPPSAAGRPGIFRPDRRSRRAGTAGNDARHRHGRVRTQPADQRHTPAGTIGRTAIRSCWPAAESKGGACWAPATKSGPIPPRTRSRPATWRRRFFRPSASIRCAKSATSQAAPGAWPRAAR